MSIPTTVEKLRAKLTRNLELGLRAFATKSVSFVGSTVKSRVLLRAVTRLGLGVRVVGCAPKIHNPGGTIEVGDDVLFDAPVTPIFLDLKPGAVLSIGEGTYMNDGVWFGCTAKISVGKHVLIGPGVRIFDNNYHGLYDRRMIPAAKPVTIEDDVWLASDCIVMPGVTVGRGAVVAAHAVVLNDVPPFCVVAGNPAKQINTLDPARFDLQRRVG